MEENGGVLKAKVRSAALGLSLFDLAKYPSRNFARSNACVCRAATERNCCDLFRHYNGVYDMDDTIRTLEVNCCDR